MHEDGRLRFVRAAIESVEFLRFLNNQIKRYLFFFINYFLLVTLV